MMLTISFKARREDKEITLMLDNEQTIGGTIRILREAGIFSVDTAFVRSIRTKERIPIKNTYLESHIYNGDILILE